MNNYGKLTDEQLIKDLRVGDTAIVDYVMDKYKFAVRRKAKAMYLLGGDNDDLIQEGMIGLFKAIRDYNVDEGASFYSFAELCISRQMYSAIEASQRKKHIPLNYYISLYEEGETTEEKRSPALIDVIQATGENNPEELVLHKEYLQLVERKLQEELSELENKVLYLHLLGTDYQTIAGLIDKSPKTVDNALQRIKKKANVIIKNIMVE
ncbi:MAG: RNA polymerase sporulation sigma factor SigH [Lachnospiraceae bacterium]